MFFHSLGEFVLILQPTERYASYISTNPHGERQPGSVVVAHTGPAKATRQTLATDQCTVSVERDTDYVMFDHHTQMYTIVGEIKSDDSLAERQNIEQMIGLWRKKQSAMLGFTCNTQCIQPRVLLRSGNFLILYRLPHLSHTSTTSLISQYIR